MPNPVNREKRAKKEPRPRSARRNPARGVGGPFAESVCRVIAERAEEGLWLIDGEGRTNYVNPRMAAMGGYEPSAMEGKNLLVFVAEETAAGLSRALQNLRQGMEQEVAFPFLRADGSVLSVRARAIPFPDGEGGVGGAILLVHDVGLKMSLEQRLRSQEETLRHLLDAFDGSALLVTREGTILEGNRWLADRWGTTPEGLVGRNVHDYLPRYVAKWRKAHLEKTFDGGETIRFEDSSQGRRYSHILCPVRDRDGATQCVAAFATDVTEHRATERALRESEARYRAIVEAFDGLLYVCSQDRRIEFMNRALMERAGYDGTGDLCYKVLHGCDAPCPWCVNDRVFLGETVRWEVQSPLDGRWLYASNTPIFHADGSISKQSMIIDITERKRAEEALRESEEKYRIVADNTFDWEFWLDHKGRFVYTSPSCLRVTGRSARDFMEDPELLGAIVHPEDRAAFEEHARDVDGRGLVGDLLFRIYHADGTVRWLHHICQPIFNRNGEHIGSRGSNRDITERVRIEHALRRSEERYRRIVDAAGEGIWVMNEDFTATFVNPQMAAMLGYAAEEIIGQHVTNFLFQEDLADHWDRAAERRKGISGRYERKFRRKDGKTLWAIVSATPIVDPQLGFQGYFAMITDISERKAMEETLRLFQFAVDHAGDAIFVTNEKGSIVYANERASDVLGYTQDEMVGMPLWTIDPRFSSSEWPRYWKDMERTKSMIFESLHRQRNGRTFPVEVMANQVVVAGTHYNCAVARNVAERKTIEAELRRSEERYRTLIDNAADAILLADEQGRLMEVNQGAALLFEGDREDFVGVDISAIHPPEDVERVRKAFSEIAGRGKGSLDDVMILTRKGRKVPVDIRGSRVTHEGKVMLLGFFRDITERKASQEALENAGKRLKFLSGRLLQAQERESRHIARELHDEIGQALTAIKINLQTAQRVEKEKLAPFLFEENVRIIDRVLGQVRSLSLELHPTILDDLGLTAALRWYVDWISQRSGLRSRFSENIGHRRLPPGIETSCFRMAQEALTNVIRHAKATAVEVELQESDGSVSLTISDNGEGFDVGQARERALKGESLGLSGMEERVVLAGGKLSAESSVGKGTTLRAVFTLPQAGARRRGAGVRVGR